jgi:hypothetical protein
LSSDSKIARIAQVSDPDEGELTNHIYYAAHGTPEFQPAVPEYKQAHMAAIVVQLDNWGSFGTPVPKLPGSDPILR